jgi:hypothetical protein
MGYYIIVYMFCILNCAVVKVPRAYRVIMWRTNDVHSMEGYHVIMQKSDRRL